MSTEHTPTLYGALENLYGTPPNTAAPPPPDAVKLSRQQIDALARFYRMGLTPADQELLSALRELMALRTSHAQLVAALDELLAVRAMSKKLAGCPNDRFESAWKQARAALASVTP